MRKTTVRPERVSTVREAVVLETPKPAKVINFPRKDNLAWLLADTLSTDSGYRS